MKYTPEFTERPWFKTFALLPKKTISGEWVWLKTLYVKRVWGCYGDQRFHCEPDNFYGTLVDVLKEQYD